jgi:signal transduction histidine kinase
VVVTLADAGDSLRLDIVDDGRGFDASRWDRQGGQGGGYGLRSMRARLRELGGGLDVESAPGDGTALSASVPLGPVSVAPIVASEEEGA